MKYSVIICYRDREEHLKVLIPRLKEVFGDEAEIIVVEQDDKDIFLRGNCRNVGAQQAKGDIFVFHDVDHYPVNVDYELPEGVDVWLPIKRVTYVDSDLKELPIDEVPSGYRHFKDSVDDDFYGGVTVWRREAFFKVNGFSSLYRGWGLEDSDLGERAIHYGLTIQRGDGEFYALQHHNNDPGVGDADFARNQQLFERRNEFLSSGVNTQFQTVNQCHSCKASRTVDRWLKTTNFTTSPLEMVPLMTIDGVTQYYEDIPEKHVAIFTGFKRLVNEYPQLKNHRDWVRQNDFGYGERAFHWMWHLICKELLVDFKFLEIGVFKGQIISLISLLNAHHRKNGIIYGITPLTNAGDKYSKHPDIDYEGHIQRIYQQFGLDASDLGIIQGLSNDPDIIETAQELGPFDVVYIDGCHDYEVVVSDVVNYCEMVKLGGLVVIDDASNYLKIPDGLIRMNWRGLEDVSNAVRDTIEKDECFEHLFAVGHNRVWRKVR